MLTDDELAKIKEMGATAAIVMHYGGNDWSQRPDRRAADQFGKMGIEVIADTDADFKPEQAGLRHRDRAGPEARHHRLDPDRPGRHRRAYKQAAEQGVKLVFMDNVPQGLHGRQGLRQRRLGRQLRQRRGLGAPDGQGAGRRGQDRR